jgi:membrane protein
MRDVHGARQRLRAQRDRCSALQARIEERRGSDSFVGAALEAIELDRRRAGGLLAGGIAFRAFLWLLPAALLATGVLGVIRDTAHEDPDVVARRLGLGGVVGSSVAGAVDQSSRSTVLLLASGAVLMLYFGVSLVRALRIASVIAWDLPAVRRPHLVRDGAIISAALSAQLACSAAASSLRGYAGPGSILVTIGVAAFACALWFGIDVLLPHGDAPFTALVPGAIMMMVALELLYLATIYYFAHRLSTSGELYGPLGVAATLLLWLFVIARVFVATMFLDAALWQRGQRRRSIHQG